MATKLTSLKLSPKEAKSEYGMDAPSPAGSNKANLPKYPYGTKIRLETEAIEKLGLDLSDYNTSQTLLVTAKVEVCGVSMRKTQGGTDRDELELQITDLCIEPDKAAKKQKASGDHLNNIGAPTGSAYATESED